MARFGRAYPVQRIYTPPPGAPVLYDATGVGFTWNGSAAATSQSGSWSHTAQAGAAVVVAIDVYSFSTSHTTATTRTATYGGTAMASLGVRDAPSGYGWVELFGLLNAPGGAQTINISLSGASATLYAIIAGSTSYGGAHSFGTAVLNSGTGTALSAGSVSSSSGRVVAQSFFAAQAGATVTIGSYNKNSRYAQHMLEAGVDGVAAVLGDASGTGAISFTATGSVSSNWASVAVPLNP